MLAFIHVAKTGGQTIETMLESSYGLRHQAAPLWRGEQDSAATDVDFVVPKYDADDFRRLKRLCPFMKSVGGHSIALWSGLHEVQPTTYFAFVREPLKRGASHFQYHVQNDQPELGWGDWVDRTVHHNHQVKMFSRSGDANDAIEQIRRHEVFVGLTERFDESLLIFRRLFRNDLNIGYVRTNTARDNTLAERVLAEPGSLADLERMYGGERPLYEWVVNEHYPGFRREYGPTLEKDLEDFRAARHRVNRLNVKLNHAWFRFVVKPRVGR